MDTPLSSLFIFGMKQWRRRGEEEEEKGRKKKRMDMIPLYIFELDSPLSAETKDGLNLRGLRVSRAWMHACKSLWRLSSQSEDRKSRAIWRINRHGEGAV